ncbi:hypothetical protein SDC9_20942 [bioreactor metagenome]|uniref:Uncharacterized protein n=1 Tax=bioreactor metagenome TaxID=1076179 RepID=A0A644U852_9ZZZZ|nr:CC/Se motif family (seleno)protein [Negativicutes bacterium]
MITISQEAREYILRKGGAVHLFEAGPVSMCCGQVDLGPSVQLGEPKNVEAYKLQEMAGIKLYLPFGFYTNNEVTINLRITFGVKSLYLQGWKLL